jgi:pyrroline-5-carboxylate reductase
MVPAYTLPPNAQDVTIMRALVKETMSREHVDTLARDIEEACATLAKKGGAHESERQKMVSRPRPLNDDGEQQDERDEDFRQGRPVFGPPP